jgi:hypothetical protein
MHGKEQVIAPLLQKHLGVETIVPQGFNSDQFGTFTGEIKRAGNQVEAARAKVQAAMTQLGMDLGIASEGSFGAHPSIPFVQSNLELLLLVDRKNGYEIRGHHRTSETNMDGQYVHSVEEALDFARKIGFPEHGVIVRKTDPRASEKQAFLDQTSDIHKNIHTEAELMEIVRQMLDIPHTDRIFVETDMRAHRNPTRMKTIEKAVEDLIQNVLSLCPNCQAPGFVVVDFETGLKCSLCHSPTELPLNDIYQCSLCNHQTKKPVTQYGQTADPQYCGYCNP